MGKVSFEDFDSIIICGLPVLLVFGVIFWVMRNWLDQSPTTLDDLEDPENHEWKYHSLPSSIFWVVVFFVVGVAILLLKPR